MEDMLAHDHPPQTGLSIDNGSHFSIEPPPEDTNQGPDQDIMNVLIFYL